MSDRPAEADEDPDEIWLPDETRVGTVPVLDELSGQTVMVACQFIETGGPVLTVALRPEVARQVALAMLGVYGEVAAAQPRSLRLTAPTSVSKQDAAMLLLDMMNHDVGPVDADHLHADHPVGHRLPIWVAHLSPPERRALHRALHDQGAEHA